jgi:thiamine pyrophosphokinase
MEKTENVVAVVLHGTIDPSMYDHIRKASCIIAADAAAILLIKHNIVPNICIGDFDSVSPQEKRVIDHLIKDVRIFPPEKDATDGELAVRAAVAIHPGAIRIYGATGGRIDHMLGVLYLLQIPSELVIDTQIVDVQNRAWMMKNTSLTMLKDESMPYVSLIPVSPTAIVTLKHFLYPLRHAQLDRTSTRGISNEISGKMGTITVHEGIVFCVQSGDR